jgi:hypothetical protein
MTYLNHARAKLEKHRDSLRKEHEHGELDAGSYLVFCDHLERERDVLTELGSRALRPTLLLPLQAIQADLLEIVSPIVWAQTRRTWQGEKHRERLKNERVAKERAKSAGKRARRAGNDERVLAARIRLWGSRHGRAPGRPRSHFDARAHAALYCYFAEYHAGERTADTLIYRLLTVGAGLQTTRSSWRGRSPVLA